ncbi:MAG: GNAT family N-acetyltransferase [Acidimicrobiales bacterium]
MADGQLEIRPASADDHPWIVRRHGALYAAEYGWDQSFEALVEEIVTEFAARGDHQRERAWIAEVDGERVGCVLCVRDDDVVARLRVLLVEPAARGTGVGSALVAECIRFARHAGYRRLDLWTNDVLVDARRVYERAGFRLVDAESHRSFGQELVGQTWTLDLSP